MSLAKKASVAIQMLPARVLFVLPAKLENYSQTHILVKDLNALQTNAVVAIQHVKRILVPPPSMKIVSYYRMLLE